MCDLFLHEDSIYSVCVDPRQSEVVATACASGEISLYDLRLRSRDRARVVATSRSSSSSGVRMSANGSAFLSCAFNPLETQLLAVANEVSGLALCDLRMSRSAVMRYTKEAATSPGAGGGEHKQMVMSCSFTRDGRHLSALRGQRLPPALYACDRHAPVVLFDHAEFANTCTLKDACFAGTRDQYFVSGSDDFSLFVWRIPLEDAGDDTGKTQLVSDAHLKLVGHRSIPNQCRYNGKYHLLASCGVEKLVKLWSPYEVQGESRTGGLTGAPNEYRPARKLYTNKDLFTSTTTTTTTTTTRSSNEEADRALDLVQMNYEPVVRNRNQQQQQSEGEATATATASTAEDSLEEDRMTIAFFDSQVRRSKRGATTATPHSSDSESDSDDDDDDDSDSDSDETDDSSPTSPHSSSTTSSSNSASATDSDSPSDDDDNDLDLEITPPTPSRRRRSDMSLRNRLRGLRHRLTLNLTEQSDYIDVLNSLNVKRQATQQHPQTQQQQQQQQSDSDDDDDDEPLSISRKTTTTTSNNAPSADIADKPNSTTKRTRIQLDSDDDTGGDSERAKIEEEAETRVEKIEPSRQNKRRYRSRSPPTQAE